MRTQIPAKLLLFGEYAVLDGCAAIALPLPDWHGAWDDMVADTAYQKMPRDQGRLVQLAQDSSMRAANVLDLMRLSKDLKEGRWVQSNIPTGYGIGSSGVVTALLYGRYALQPKQEIVQLKRELASIESFFHGRSSGIDPLTSYLAKPIHYTSEQEITVFDSLQDLPMRVELFDSGRKRSSTEGLVEAYKRKLAHEDAAVRLADAIRQCQSRLITACITGAESDQFRPNLVELSSLQLALFRGLWIPEDIVPIWEAGLQSHAPYVMKLCGAGGGGFFQKWVAT